MAQKQKTGFIGCGNVRVAPYNPDGSFSNQWYELGETKKYELKENVKEIDPIISNRCESKGQAVETLYINDVGELSIDVQSMFSKNLALLFNAELEKVTGSVDAFSDEITTTDTTGVLAKLSLGNIDPAGFTVKDNSGTDVDPALWELVDSKAGFIQLKDSIPAGTYTIAGNTLAVDKDRMVGGSAVGKRVRVMFSGMNFNTKKHVENIVADVTLVPTGGFDFMASQYATGALTGKPTVNKELGFATETTVAI